MRRWFRSRPTPDNDNDDAELDQLFRYGLQRQLGQPAPDLSFRRVRARVLANQPARPEAYAYRMARGGGPGGSNLSGFGLLFYVLNSSPRSAWNSVPG